jgi:adenine-specific DNA methylase
MVLADVAPTSRNPIRPVQFLGAKSRSLPVLLGALEDEIPGDAVADIFSGSSLVAQGLARSGHLVSACDALEHCAHFARALLGVGRDEGEAVPQLELRLPDWADGPWGSWLAREREALAREDAEALLEISLTLPQVWRADGASCELTDLFAGLAPGSGPAAGLVASHYAGTYFGLEQALEIDLIRGEIAAARNSGAIDRWQESLLITALLSAASECAFSAGKHYAQPHRIRRDKDLAFLRGRVLSDRGKGLLRLFEERVSSLHAAALPDEGHRAEARTLEQLVREPQTLGAVEAIYADPPYTAQQYSRFYHVPEVISSYRVPNLQRIDGAVTRGLYPEPTERHHSRFCSRREAPDAFADLCDLAVERGALLCLSYSFTRSGETGNRRSIDLPELRAVVEERFSKVVELEIPLAYRQFNAGGHSLTGRSDAEILIVARNR